MCRERLKGRRKKGRNGLLAPSPQLGECSQAASSSSSPLLSSFENLKLPKLLFCRKGERRGRRRTRKFPILPSFPPLLGKGCQGERAIVRRRRAEEKRRIRLERGLFLLPPFLRALQLDSLSRKILPRKKLKKKAFLRGNLRPQNCEASAVQCTHCNFPPPPPLNAPFFCPSLPIVARG